MHVAFPNSYGLIPCGLFCGLDWKALVRCGMFEGCLAFHGSEVIALSCGIWAPCLMGIRRASGLVRVSSCQ